MRAAQPRPVVAPGNGGDMTVKLVLADDEQLVRSGLRLILES